jgi:hypothetical protein
MDLGTQGALSGLSRRVTNRGDMDIEVGRIREVPHRRRSVLTAKLTDARVSDLACFPGRPLRIPYAAALYGYSMNRMGERILLNPRGQSLVDVTYRALGHDSNDAGVWTRADSHHLALR